MTKSDLVELVVEKKGVSGCVAEKTVQEIFRMMAETLIADGRIEIRGFGSFENREYDGRPGRNPKTGEIVAVGAKKRPFFKCGKELKERINSAEKYSPTSGSTRI